MKANKVWTPNGYQRGPVNSLVGKGESIIDYTNGTGTLVTKGKVGVDNQPSSVNVNDDNVIAGNDVDWSNGMKFSDQVAPLTAKLQMYNNMEKKVNSKPNLSSLSKQTIQLQKSQIDRAKAPILNAMKKITDRQQAQHEAENSYREMPMYDKGKPASSSKKTGFFNKIWNSVGDYFSKNKTVGAGKVPQSWLINGRLIPAIAEARMLQHWKNEQPKMPSIYAPNRYAAPALQALNKLSVDPYSQIQALNDKERQAYYGIQQNGGYTGGQRQAARVALALGNAKTAADILHNTQLQNNTYRQNWAEAALQEGSQDASRRQSAAQYAWDAYNRAHGAKTKGIETHLSNLGAMWQKYYADKIKNKQYEDILNIYQQDIDNRKDALKTIYGIGGDGNKSITGNTTSGAKSTVTSGPINNTASGTTSGNLNILNQYYHSTPLGDVFSLYNPYRIPQTDMSMQRIPKGKYWMIPDQIPSKRYNSDQIRQAISGAQNARQWAQNILNQNEINMGTIGDGNIYRDAYIRLNIPTNLTWDLQNKQKRIAGTDSQEISGMNFNRGKNRKKR